MFSQFKKVDGCYWVSNEFGEKKGYKSLNALFVGEYYYQNLGIVSLILSASILLVVGILAVAN
jgi:hypothetical protein